MTNNNADDQIAREWALRAVESAENAQPVSRGALAAARHVLSTTTPPTMADVEWDNDVHSGLCAEHCEGDEVLMLGPDLDNEDAIICHWIHYGSPVTEKLLAEKLTPIPGTKINLTPRREPVPESTPDHPEFLETEEDYAAAPEGTIVAEDEGKPFVMRGETWRVGGSWVLGHSEMAGIRRRVLRRGWEA